MAGNPNKILKQIAILAIVFTLLTLAIVYPFMQGDYDRLAEPLSTLVQCFGILGLLFPVLAVFWLSIPKWHIFFANSFLYLGIFLAMALAFFAWLSGGKLFGIIIFSVLILILVQTRKFLKESNAKGNFRFLQVCMILLPLYTLGVQLFLAKPVTDRSREKSIANAGEYINDIENFKAANGYYPKTLEAMYADYSPRTVGVEKFHYMPFADSYNILFAQPRFLLDDIGTSEWVVFNPKNEHKAFSHTSWLLLLSPAEAENRQGWYASKDTKFENWKIFLFD